MNDSFLVRSVGIKKNVAPPPPAAVRTGWKACATKSNEFFEAN